MTGDFDGDGYPDVLNWSWVMMRLSNQPPGVWLEDRPDRIADLNEDGIDDIVT